MRLFSIGVFALLLTFGSCLAASAQTAAPQKVIVDADIGDDIDDAFALALLLHSPELEVLGISASWGDTALRMRLLRRFLQAGGRTDIPLAQGPATRSAVAFTQARWAQAYPAPTQAERPAVDFLLEQLRAHPGQITLLALGPLTTLAAAQQRDPQTFAKLQRIVMMGGSVRRGYGKSEYQPPSPPSAEYNLAADIAAARRVLGAGVPIVMMPLDSTLVRLDELKRNALFAHGSPATDALTLLYHQWTQADQPWASETPTLFDVVPLAYLIDPSLCPTTMLSLAIDDQGYTREDAAGTSLQVCLQLDRTAFFNLFMSRLLR
jgi:inosine-uridine nucleoside N-ribohydrolase